MTSTPQQTHPTGPAETTSAPAPAVQAPNSSTATAPSFSVPAQTSARSSYASATKGGFPPNVSEPSNMSVAAAGRPPADAISPVNGRNPTIPAVPSVGPTIVNGNNSDHTRKPSFTVTPSGATNFAANGGAVGAVGGGQNKANNIQFGSVNAGGSPAQNNPPALVSQSSSNLGVAPPNPRIISPQNSPSPIPQPAASGGRPPSSLQGQSNQPVFGQLGGDPNDPSVCSQPAFLGLLTNGFRSEHYVLCHKVQWARVLSHRIFAETPLTLHMRECLLRECLRAREELAIRWPAEVEEGTQGSTILR